MGIIRKVQTHWAYQIAYYTVYLYMLMNDSIRLYFFPKWADIPFTILTFISAFLYVIDIVFRCI